MQKVTKKQKAAQFHVDDLRLERLREIAVIGALMGIDKDELGEEAKCWILQSLIKIKNDYISAEPHPTLHRLPLPRPTTETIGARIQLARETIGMSERELAIAIGVPDDVEALQEWENDKSEPCATEIMRLATALKCDPLWLLGDFDGIEPPALTEAPLAPVKIMQGVDMSGVGKRIRESRVSRRMTSEELENAAHLPEGVTPVWESGKAYPPDEAFDKLAKALNTSVTWLLTGRQITKRNA